MLGLLSILHCDGLGSASMTDGVYLSTLVQRCTLADE